jgi:hypothetical protein
MTPISFKDLFDHIGDARMKFSKRAEALSGTEVELRGYLAAMHANPKQIVLAGEAGVCPDCAESPVPFIDLPGYAPRGDLFGAQAIRLKGTLRFGFEIMPEGYASFLRLENAGVAIGLNQGFLLSGKRT